MEKVEEDAAHKRMKYNSEKKHGHARGGRKRSVCSDGICWE